MSLRETITQKPAVAGAVAGGLLLLAVIWTVYAAGSNSSSDETRAYYSNDDGKTWFVDRSDRVTPFDHNGKPAVRAMLFTADDHETSFVGYLERHKPATAKKLLEAQAASAAGKPATLNPSDVTIKGTEFKKPGDAKWTPGSDLQAREKLIKSFTPPGAVLDSVLP